jgi:hypothetical protein
VGVALSPDSAIPGSYLEHVPTLFIGRMPSSGKLFRSMTNTYLSTEVFDGARSLYWSEEQNPFCCVQELTE